MEFVLGMLFSGDPIINDKIQYNRYINAYIWVLIIIDTKS